MMSAEVWDILGRARCEVAELVAARSYLPDLHVLVALDRLVLSDPRAQGPGPIIYTGDPDSGQECDAANVAVKDDELQRRVEQDTEIINGLRKELAELRRRLREKK